jgi:hypothetical protein
VDLIAADVPDERRLDGQYVLKLDHARAWADAPEIPERERHEAIFKIAPEFAEQHLPKLVWSRFEETRGAMLYEIAGLRLAGLRDAAAVDSGALARLANALGMALLRDLNRGVVNPVPEATARDTLANWLEHRLHPDSLLRQRLAQLDEGRPAIVLDGELLLNPLALCDSPAVGRQTHTRLDGLIHGDLHLGNVLVNTSMQPSNYWLIDFALSRKAPLLYDHAYFELALILAHMRGARPARLFSLLHALESPSDQSAWTLIGVEDVGLRDCVGELRSAMGDWQRAARPNRGDDFAAQELLARVAVGLNWINKPGVPLDAQRLALAYSAWAARSYLQTYDPDKWTEVSSGLACEAPTDEPDGEAAMGGLWSRLSGFDDGSGRFVLVAGALPKDDAVSSLAALPWSAVVDLDPASDKDGLASRVLATLDERRAVHPSGGPPGDIDFTRGTAWLMAAGWESHDQPPPEREPEWRRKYLASVRALGEGLRRASAPLPVYVVVLPGKVRSGVSLDRILEALDESLGEGARFEIVASQKHSGATVEAQRSAISESAFCRRVADILGTQDEPDVIGPAIPGAGDTFRVVPASRLRNLEEDLEIVHTQVIDAERLNARPRDAFWRGSTPTWTDLNTGSDVLRDIHGQLVTTLTQALSENRNRNFELHHHPGAGGTTAALRAAWVLHRRYPTAVLRRLSEHTVERVDDLFHLADRPVLLILDGALVTAAAREQLYRGFVERNSRVVTLHVVRSTQPSRGGLQLVDPMSAAEAQDFLQVYREQTTDGARRRQLSRIARAPQLARYRSPFFFGLTTFEREFESLPSYVAGHLGGINAMQRRVLRLIALITRFSQVGVHEGLVRSWLDQPLAEDVDLAPALGPGPARLIVRDGQHVKILHPLVAEEVLRQLLTDRGSADPELWRSVLGELSIELIDAVTEVVQPSDEETQQLFTQLFIDRGFVDEGRRRAQFSELLSTIPNREAAYRVLKRLTEADPDEPHYWNHLGRYHIYEMEFDAAEAENFLLRAVDLASDDAIHHHTLGLVRRIGIERNLDKLFRDAEHSLKPQDVLDHIGEAVQAAEEAFAAARQLDRSNEHGYVTHIQMFLHVAQRIARTASDGRSILSLAKGDDPIARWVRVRLAECESLLTTVLQHAGREPSDYILRVQGDLTEIYGDFEGLIETWEALLPSAVDRVALGRVLASTYLARRGRSWARVSEGELRRIAGLMEDNLREDPTNAHDLRTWFQATRRLPEFDPVKALSRLNTWAARSDSVDAHFYLYILHYLLVREGTEVSHDAMHKHLGRCADLAGPRRHLSYEWLAEEPEWCPLVSTSDLDGWDPTDDAVDPPKVLAIETGFIERIRSPKAGRIRLPNGLSAFFVPGQEFLASRDIGAVVKLLIGFSYDGARAWRVHRPGEDARGSRPRTIDLPAWNELAVVTGPVDLPDEKPSYGRRRSHRARKRPEPELQAKVQRFIYESLERVPTGIRVNQLEGALRREFDDRQIKNLLGRGGLAAFVGRLPDLKVKEERVMRERSSTVSGLDREELFNAIRSEAHDANRKGRSLGLQRLGARLLARFPGGSVAPRAGFKSLSALVAACPDVSLDRSGPQPAVVVGDWDAQASVSKQQRLDREQVFEGIREILREAPGQELALVEVGNRLRNRFGGGSTARRSGFQTLGALVRACPGVVLHAAGPSSRVLLEPSPPDGSATRPISVDEAFEAVRNHVSAADREGRELRLEALANALRQQFGQGSIAPRVGFRTLSALINACPGVELVKAGARATVVPSVGPDV